MYRFFKHCCTISLVAFAFVQCTRDLTNEIAVGELHSTSATKIINTSRSAVAGTLLIKFDESAALAFENGTRSAGVTRSNIEPLNEVLLDVDAVSIERVFPVDKRNEEATRRAGLHLWYMVRFDKEQSLDKVANALAQIGEIQTIQFDAPVAVLEKPSVIASEQSVSLSNATRTATPQFNDPDAGMQWDFYNPGESYNSNAVAGMDINVREAWRYTTGDPSIVVAVIDQGVDYTHEDLAGNMWVNVAEQNGLPGVDDDGNGYVDDIHGYNFVDNGPISWDKDVQPVNNEYGDVGHGTHIAGTIAAVNNNGVGICGIAGGDGTQDSGVKIMSAQIFSGRNQNNGTASVVAKAFKYATDNGAALANNSWGSDPSSPYSVKNDAEYRRSMSIEYEAIVGYYKNAKHSNLNGGVAIFAAGNNGYKQSCYPGAYRDFVSVTAFGIDGDKASYSNYGPGCNIAAPGGDQANGGQKGAIYSTMSPIYKDKNGNLLDVKYSWEQGTSMACPHVTGVAALGLAYAKKLGKSLTAEEFITKLLLSVNDIDSYLSESYKGMMGTGRIDAFKFLMNIEGITCIPVQRGVGNYKIDVNKYMADGNVNLKLVDMTISDADMKRLGMSSKPRYLSTTNVFVVTCNNVGSAIVTVKMIAGGDTAGSDNTVGGKTITKEFALVVRDSYAENGGWL